MTDPTLTWEDDGGPCAEDDAITVEVPATPAQIAAYWEAAAEVAPGQKSCGTCRHWEPQQDGDGSSDVSPIYADPDLGYCRIITHGTPPFDIGAEIVGGGQGVDEDIRLETHRTRFWCALWGKSV